MNQKLILIVLIGLALGAPGAISAAETGDPGWPRVREVDGNQITTYQPQVDDWKSFQQLSWRMAVSVVPNGGKQPIIGVVEMKGDTAVDFDNKVVHITNMQITGTHFPPDSESAMDALLRKVARDSVTISLHRLIACVPKTQAPAGVALDNDPPRVFVGYRPSILLGVDGPPSLSEIPGTSLKYVVNTQWPLFYDGSSYYLAVGKDWLSSSALDGQWNAIDTLPKGLGFRQLPKYSQWSSLKSMIPPAGAAGDTIPAVFYSDKPADVILFDGQPVYTQIPDTQLQYATNTSSVLFVHTPTQEFYYLTAGRWFRANDLHGPWTYASADLPADFANIPPDCPASAVLSTVPGTDEAKDAVLLARVPTTMTVDPAKAQAKVLVDYSGDPKFEPITGTSMSYAVNTQDKVVQVGDKYYLCLQGIWFDSASPQGPWATAQSVPQDIYTIPPSSPVYNVTYVTQNADPDGSIVASYTPGYLGAFILGAATGAVVANGSGFWAPPYCSALNSINGAYNWPTCYSGPGTYGAGYYGAAHYNPTTGNYGWSQTAYGPYGTAASRGAAYNPYTGTVANGARVSTPYGSRTVAQAYNPYTGRYAATSQGSSPTSQWGRSYLSNGSQSAYTQHYSNANGTVGTAHGSQGGRAAYSNTAWGRSVAGETANGDMYAGHDGNVYKNTGSGWQTYQNGSWNNVNKPTPNFSGAASSRPSSQEYHPAAPSNEYHPSSTGEYHPSTSNGYRPSSAGESHPQIGFGGGAYSHPSESFQSRSDDLQREAMNRERGNRESSMFSSESSRFGGGGFQRGGGGFGRGGGGGRGFR